MPYRILPKKEQEKKKKRRTEQIKSKVRRERKKGPEDTNIFMVGVKAYMGQGSVPVHKPFGLLKSWISFCDHIHCFFPNKLQGIQPPCDDSLPLKQ